MPDPNRFVPKVDPSRFEDVPDGTPDTPRRRFVPVVDLSRFEDVPTTVEEAKATAEQFRQGEYERQGIKPKYGPHGVKRMDQDLEERRNVLIHEANTDPAEVEEFNQDVNLRNVAAAGLTAEALKEEVTRGYTGGKPGETHGIVRETGRQLLAGTERAASAVGLGMELAGKHIRDYYADGPDGSLAKGPRIPLADSAIERVGQVLSSNGREVSEFWNRAASKLPQSADIQGSIFDKPELLANPKWWASNLGNMTPGLLASVMAAIAATPTGPAGMAAAGGLVGGLQEGASTRETALERGMTDDESLDAGEKMAVASGILNALSVDNMINRGARNKLMKFLIGGGVEAATEYAEEPAEGLILGEDLNQFMERLVQGLNVLPVAAVTGGGGSLAFSGNAEQGKGKDKTPPPAPTMENIEIIDGQVFSRETGEFVREATADDMALVQERRNGLDETRDQRSVKRVQEQAAAEAAAASDPQVEYARTADEMVRRYPDQYETIRKMQERGEPLDIIQGVVKSRVTDKPDHERWDRGAREMEIAGAFEDQDQREEAEAELRRSPEGAALLRDQYNREQARPGVPNRRRRRVEVQPEEVEGEFFQPEEPGPAEESARVIEEEMGRAEQLNRSPIGAQGLRERLEKQRANPRKPFNRKRKSASSEEVEGEMYGPSAKMPPATRDLDAWNNWVRNAGFIAGDEELDLGRIREIEQKFMWLRDGKMSFDDAGKFFKSVAVKEQPNNDTLLDLMPSEAEEDSEEKPVDTKKKSVYHDGKFLNIRRDRINTKDTPALAILLGAGVRLPGGKILSEITDLFDGVRVYTPFKGGKAVPYDVEKNAQEDLLVDEWAQTLHDYHDYGGGEGNHELTFDDLLEAGRQDLSRIIDGARAENRNADLGGVTESQARNAEKDWKDDLREEGFTDDDIAAVLAGTESEDDIRRALRESQRIGEEEGLREADEAIRGIQGESEEDVLAFFSQLAEQDNTPPEEPRTKEAGKSAPRITADHTTAITDLTDSTTGETIPAGTPHYALDDGRFLSEESFRKLNALGEQEGLFAPGEVKNTPGEKRTKRTEGTERTRKPKGEDPQNSFMDDLTGQSNLFSVKEQTPSITEADIRAIFSVGEITANEDGSHTVRIGKKELTVRAVEQITPDGNSFRIQIGRSYDAKQDVIAGEYADGDITVSRAGDRWTLAHESWHWVEDLGVVTEAETRALDRAAARVKDIDQTANPEEKRAQFIEQALKDRALARRHMVGRVIQKIADWIDGIVNVAVRTARGVVRDVESGRMARREAEPVPGDVPKYSVRKKSEQFNLGLERYSEGKMKTHEYLEIGRPNATLLGAGIPDNPIIIRAERIDHIEKSHPEWAIQDVLSDLPELIQKPFLIFNPKIKPEGKKIIVVGKIIDGKPVTVILELNRHLNKVQINNVSSVFGKDINKLSHWIDDDNLLYADIKNSPYPSGTLSLLDEAVQKLMSKISQWTDSVKGNREGQDGTGTRYSVKQRAEIQEEITGHVLDFLGGLKDSFDKIPGKPDLSKLDWLSLPTAWAEKVPALKRLVGAAVKIPEYKFVYQGTVFGVEGDPEAHIKALRDFSWKNPKEYQKLGKYLFTRDRNRWGYRVKRGKEGYDLLDPAGATVKTYDSEAEAWADAILKEAEDLKRSGYSADAVEVLKHVRQIGHNMYAMLHRSADEIISQAQERGEEIPTITSRGEDGKTVEVNLRVALAKMGDLRGSYMPRIRQTGGYMVIAKKAGENSRLEFALTKIGAGTRRRELAREGYEVTVEKAKGLSEDVYAQMGGTMAIEAMLNTAAERMGKQEPDMTIGDFGYGMDRRPDKTVVLRGKKREKHAEIFKKFGGNAHPSEGNMYQWVFHGLSKKDETAIVDALLEAGEIPNQTPEKFWQLLVEGVADVLREHGALSHRIARTKATGKDVWLGYEENPIKALAMAGSAISGAAAKHDAALEMYRAITGKDQPFAEWKAAHGNGSYRDYIKFTKERGIDPERQQEAHKTALAYFQDVLRNEESIERIFGIAKGLATLKFLAFRVSTGLINLTAIPTAAAGNISAKVGVPIRTALRKLGTAGTQYAEYRMGKLGAEESRVFQEIEKRGWDEAQYNRALLSSLRGSVGNAYDRIIDVGMWMSQATEKVNRVTTIAGAYLSMKEKATGIWTEQIHLDALERAKEISDKAHGVYGKSNIPMALRGSNVGSSALRSWFTFKTYPYNYLLTMKENFGGDRQAKIAALWMSSAGAILGGAKLAIPVAVILRTLGLVMDEDPEEMLYGWVEDHLGGIAERITRYGAAGLAGVNIRNSLDTGVANLIPDPKDMGGWTKFTIMDLLGAPGGVLTDEAEAVYHLSRGEILKSMEKALPSGLGAPLRAYREYTQGQTTRQGTPVFFGDEQIRASKLEAAIRTFGFNPARTSEMSEIRRSEYKTEGAYRKEKERIYAHMKEYWLRPAEKRSPEEWISLMAEAREYNQKVRAHGHPRSLMITRLGINAAKRRTTKPPKRERDRD